MTIGIFGDSFGDWDVKGGVLKNLSWPFIVAEWLGQRCINKCNGGASLFYSYKTFLEHAHECDTIIFLLTNPGRYTKPFIFESVRPPRAHINSLIAVENFLKDSQLTPTERQQLEYLQGFYISQDFNWEHTACNLLADEIKRVRPDTIFIPCFNFYREKLECQVTLQDIVEAQTRSFGINREGVDFQRYHSEHKVVCHYTDVVNRFVASSVVDSVTNNKWVCTLPETFVHTHPVDYYYRSII